MSASDSVDFGAITAFIVLLFPEHGWSRGWLAYTTFATVFILTRLVLGHLPDKVGGTKVAFVSMLIEAAGQALIWLAQGPDIALVGAGLSGLGYSLVLDVALGFGTPALGLIAGGAGLGAAFLASALAALGSAAVSIIFIRPQSTEPTCSLTPVT